MVRKIAGRGSGGSDGFGFASIIALSGWGLLNLDPPIGWAGEWIGAIAG